MAIKMEYCKEEEMSKVNEQISALKKKAETRGKKIKILAISGEPELLKCLKMIFYFADIELETAAQGEKALELLDPDFDLVFTDFKLEGKMTGFEVLKRAKEKCPFMPVAIITENLSVSSHANAIQLGAFEYLKKPFLIEDLYDLINRGLARREKNKE